MIVPPPHLDPAGNYLPEWAQVATIIVVGLIVVGTIAFCVYVLTYT